MLEICFAAPRSLFTPITLQNLLLQSAFAHDARNPPCFGSLFHLAIDNERGDLLQFVCQFDDLRGQLKLCNRVS